MKIPSADYPITIELNPKRVAVKFNGRTVADTLLERTTHASQCPYKGDAAYYTIRVDGREAKNAVWAYEAPYPAVAEIKEHVAFYPDRVDRIEESPAVA
jgi:uncharacterized protein (DUF427 family)